MENEFLNLYKELLQSIAEIYYSMHLIDLTDYSIKELEGNDLMRKVIGEGANAADMLKNIVRITVPEDFVDSTLEFVDLDTVGQRLVGKRFISMDAPDNNVGWLRVTFIKVDAKTNEAPTKVILATQIVDEEKRKEKELALKANTDELTGLPNRRDYENDMLMYPDVPPEPDFVYATVDMNGLNVVNDTYGHAAGDELIKELHHMTSCWRGENGETLALAIGYASKREFQVETVEEMAKIADKRMYEDKAAYYGKKGVDRRGLASAHLALCSLYTKILKINITDDTYSIINMDGSEQTAEKGFGILTPAFS